MLNRDFWPKELNQVYTGDITHIWTTEVKLYLTMAVRRRKPTSGVIFHSDRGFKYASADFKSLLAKYRMRCSMSRKRDCWDNAAVENFFGSLKQELVFHLRYPTRFHT